VILLPRSIRIYLATAPVSLRKSFEGLSNEVRTLLKANPLSGHVFLFVNRRRTQVKMLMWTRVDSRSPQAPRARALHVSTKGKRERGKRRDSARTELAMLLEDWRLSRRKARHGGIRCRSQAIPRTSFADDPSDNADCSMAIVIYVIICDCA